MVSRAKYLRLPQLYVTGTEVVLKDGTVAWVQVLNPMELDEARHDASVARSRLVLALKSGHASDEMDEVKATLLADGHDRAVKRLVDAELSKKLMNIILELRDDPDWTERLEVVERNDAIMAKPVEDSERKLLDEINRDYLTEIAGRQGAEEESLKARYSGFDDAALIEAYIDLYVENRGSELALAEFRLTEMWYAVRACDGVQVEGEWDHCACGSHEVKVFDTKADVRGLPEELQTLLSDALAGLTMTVREAKNLARQGSSSESSPLPSEPAESTASTSTATLVAVPGI